MMMLMMMMTIMVVPAAVEYDVKMVQTTGDKVQMSAWPLAFITNMLFDASNDRLPISILSDDENDLKLVHVAVRPDKVHEYILLELATLLPTYITLLLSKAIDLGSPLRPLTVIGTHVSDCVFQLVHFCT